MINLFEIEFLLRQEFADIVSNSLIIEGKIRLFLIDGTYIDLWWSKIFEGRFSFHWQRKDGSLYRVDNIPHKSWEGISTFPFHFHEGEKVISNPFSNDLDKALIEFMTSIRSKLEK